MIIPVFLLLLLFLKNLSRQFLFLFIWKLLIKLFCFLLIYKIACRCGILSCNPIKIPRYKFFTQKERCILPLW